MTFTEFSGLFNQTTGQGNQFYCLALYSQGILETGHFKSNIYNTCKNLFGMRPSSVRTKYWDDKYTTEANGEFASYASRLHSVIDRVDLDTFNGVMPPTSIEDIERYYEAIKAKGYTHESNYVSSLMQITSSVLSNATDTEQAFGDTDGDLMDEQPQSSFIGGLVAKIGLPLIIIVGLYFTRKMWLPQIKNIFKF